MEFREQVAIKKQELNEKRDSNAEYQRRSQMTSEEKGRDALERSAKNRKEFNDFKEGRDTSLDRAEKEIREIVKDKIR